MAQETFLMENFPQFEALRRDEEVLRYQFISTELDLALTFIGISRSTDDEERSECNLNHANKAVEAAKKYLGGTKPFDEQTGRARRKSAEIGTPAGFSSARITNRIGAVRDSLLARRPGSLGLGTEGTVELFSAQYCANSAD